MEEFYRIQMNLMAILTLFVVFLIARKSFDRKNPLNRSFLVTSTLVFLGTILETLANIFDGNLAYSTVAKVLYAVLFMAAPMTAFSFFYFIISYVHLSKKLTRLKLFLIFLPVLLNIIPAILSIRFGLLFQIDASGVYHNGDYFVISGTITTVYYFLSLAIILKNRHNVLKEDVKAFLVILSLPVVGGAIQLIFIDVLVFWAFSTASVLLIYLFLQGQLVRVDSQTGAWTRESFYNLYSRRIALDPSTVFGAIYLDIDNLKAINDSRGHLEGDSAITTAIDLIRNALSSKDIICRLGGDEFIILIEIDSLADVKKTLDKIKLQFEEFRKLQMKPYAIDCSFGCGIFSSEFGSLEGFLRHIDTLMYKDKNSKKPCLT